MPKVREIAKLVGDNNFSVKETSEFCFAFLNQVAKDSEAVFVASMLDVLEGEFMTLSGVTSDD